MPVEAKGRRSVEAARRVDRLATEGSGDPRYERNMYGMGGKVDRAAGQVMPMKKVADARALAAAVNRAEYVAQRAQETGSQIRAAQAAAAKDYTGSLVAKRQGGGRLQVTQAGTTGSVR